MAGAWEPELRVHETGHGCRLTLVGVTYGDGTTLTEAADDLIGRLLTIVDMVCTSGLRLPLSMGPVDHRLGDLLWELGDIVRAGGDIRHRVFGFTPTTPTRSDDTLT
jgi:hypothetical protein